MEASRWGLVLLGCLLAGCSSTQLQTFKFWPAKTEVAQSEPNVEEFADETDPEAEPQADHLAQDETTTPIRRPPGQNRISTQETSPATASRTQKVEHDVETQEMIADELAAATPEEREEMKKQWAQTPSPVVRELIALRRKERTARETPQRPGSPQEQHLSRNFPASQENDDSDEGLNRQPARNTRLTARQPANPGLGTNPWGNRPGTPEPDNSRFPAMEDEPTGSPYRQVSHQQSTPNQPVQSQFGQQPLNHQAAYPRQQPGAPLADGFPPVFDTVDTPPAYPAPNSGPYGAMQPGSPGPNTSPYSNTQPGYPSRDESPYYQSNVQPVRPAPLSPGYQQPAPSQNSTPYPPADDIFSNPSYQSQPGYPNNNTPAPGYQNPNDQYPLYGQPTSATEPQPLPKSPLKPGSSLEADYQKLIALAEAEVGNIQPGKSPAEVERYTQSHVNLRLLYYLAGQPERSIQPIPGIAAPEQEFWQQVFWGLANYFDAENMPQATERATQTVARLQQAADQLKARSSLELQNVCFCQRINSFGSYEKFPADQFSRGQPVALYAEVRNFASRASPDGQTVETALRSIIEVYTPGPNPQLADRVVLPVSRESTRTPRHDYYQSYNFQIPQNLALGPHVLKLTVEDLHGRKVAGADLNFTVR